MFSEVKNLANVYQKIANLVKITLRKQICPIFSSKQIGLPSLLRFTEKQTLPSVIQLIDNYSDESNKLQWRRNLVWQPYLLVWLQT
jgi:hypothetical protein